MTRTGTGSWRGRLGCQEPGWDNGELELDVGVPGQSWPGMLRARLWLSPPAFHPCLGRCAGAVPSARWKDRGKVAFVLPCAPASGHPALALSLSYSGAHKISTRDSGTHPWSCHCPLHGEDLRGKGMLKLSA